MNMLCNESMHTCVLNFSGINFGTARSLKGHVISWDTLTQGVKVSQGGGGGMKLLPSSIHSLYVGVGLAIVMTLISVFSNLYID